MMSICALETREFREGDTNCWIRGKDFSIADIGNGYDVRRPITDKIIESIENNNATILFGDGCCGKSVLLKRIMFEEIEREYAVLFGDSTEIISKPDQLYDLINRISEDYPKLLLIVDNVHKAGGESIFGAFNKIELNKIKFLFAARENYLDMDKNEIGRAFENIPSEAQFRIGFDRTDAPLFMTQAIKVSKRVDPNESDTEYANGLYDNSEGDLFMFMCGVRYFLSEDEKTYEDFITKDIKQKIKQLNSIEGQENRATNWKALLLCYVLGIAGIPVSIQNSSDLLGCCDVTDRYTLESLAELDLLLKQVESKQEQYRYKARHERYAIAFLAYLYDKEFGNNPKFFNKAHQIRDIIKCVWKYIGVNNIIDLLNTCSFIYNNGEAYKKLSKLMTAGYVVPYDKFKSSARLTDLEKVRLFCYGLGNFFAYTKDYVHSLDYYKQATNIDKNFVSALNNKGLALFELRRYEEAIKAFKKAIKIKPDYAIAWNNKGNALVKLGRREDAIQSYEE